MGQLSRQFGKSPSMNTTKSLRERKLRLLCGARFLRQGVAK
jgi:hypothetical protein